MKKITPIAVLTAWIALAFSASHSFAATTTTGTIEGRVFNAATGTALANVRVTVNSTAQEALTDAGGIFRFAGVAAGRVQLNARYVGLQPKTIVVEVKPGEVVQSEIELQRPSSPHAPNSEGVVLLDALNVVEEREMSAQALAINEQRHSANIKSVVARDEFDYRGNENIGDFLAFLPGLSTTNAGLEPRFLSLRGLPPNTSGIQIDGGEIASSQEGNARDINLREVPMVNVSRVEVNKVPTPDMPASSMGGSVNLVTSSGFEAKRPKFTYNFYTPFPSSTGLTFDAGPRNHHPMTSPRHIEPSFDLSYLFPVNKSLAFTAGLSRTWRQRPQWEREPGYFGETATWDLVRLVQTASQYASLAQVYKTLSGQLGIEYRLGSKGLLSASFQYREYSRKTTRTGLQLNYGAGATGDANHTQGASTGVGTVMQGLGWDTNYNENRQVTVKYQHRGDVWKFNAHGSWSSADATRKDIDDGFFTTVSSSISNLILRGDGIGATGGFLPTRFSAVTRTGEAVDIYDGALYSIPGGNSAQNRTETTKQNLRMDLARDLPTPIPVTIRIGASIDQLKKDLRAFNKSWAFRPNGATDVTARLAGRFDVFDEEAMASGSPVYGVKYRELSNAKLYDLYKQHPDWFVLDEPGAYQNLVTGSRELQETVTASFVRGDFRLLNNRLWVVTGVRFERTDGKGRGPLNDINAQYQRTPNGDYVRNAQGQRVLITNDALALRKLRFQERAASREGQYSGYYPSLNATYTLTENLLLRAAYAKSLGRPNLAFIVPGSTTTEPDIPDPTITVNNTELKPWTAHGFDLTLEAYDLKGGTGTISAFQKNITDFFGAVSMPVTPELLEQYGLPDDGTLNNYRLVTRHNTSEKTKVKGLEFGYRQSLIFLPSWARGFQVFLNATKLKLEGSNTADFDGFKPSYYAGGINFIRPRFYVKMTYTYEGEARLGALSPSGTIPPNTFDYAAKRTRTGVSAQYSFNSRYSLYVSIPDLGGFVQVRTRNADSTPSYARNRDRNDLGYYTTIGIRGTF